MMENHHEVLILEDAFVGTGHNSEIVTDDRGNDWVLYHAVSREHPTGRVLKLVGSVGEMAGRKLKGQVLL